MQEYRNYSPSYHDMPGLNLPDHQSWLVVVGQNRDSDCEAESNFATALKLLGGEENENLLVCRFGHWACGWLEIILINPEHVATLAIAEDIESKLKDYPILDESDLSEREMEAANEVWQAGFSDKERVKYIKENRTQFEFHDFGHMLGCCRGDYFGGYASELLG